MKYFVCYEDGMGHSNGRLVGSLKEVFDLFEIEFEVTDWESGGKYPTISITSASDDFEDSGSFQIYKFDPNQKNQTLILSVNGWKSNWKEQVEEFISENWDEFENNESIKKFGDFL